MNITPEAIKCLVCGDQGEAEKITGAVHLFRPPPGAWCALVDDDSDAQAIAFVCSDECARAFAEGGDRS